MNLFEGHAAEQLAGQAPIFYEKDFFEVIVVRRNKPS